MHLAIAAKYFFIFSENCRAGNRKNSQFNPALARHCMLEMLRDDEALSTGLQWVFKAFFGKPRSIFILSLDVVQERLKTMVAD